MARVSRPPLSTTDKVVLAALPFTVLAFAWAISAEREAFVALSMLLLVSCAVLSLRAFSPDPTPHHVNRHTVRGRRSDRRGVRGLLSGRSGPDD